MTAFILARHGETEWNVEEIFRGRTELDLNVNGVKQAELLAGYLREVKIEAIYSSPLRRAARTAAIIASSHDLKVIPAPGLTDMDFGEWQGLGIEQVKNKYPELFEEWATRPQRLRIPGGESLQAIRRRVRTVVDEVKSVHTGTVLLVSHRAVIKVLICYLLGLGVSHFWNIRQDTCGITTFIFENERFTLTEHNNTCFLKPLGKAPLSDF